MNRQAPMQPAEPANGHVRYVNDQQARELFDRAARHYMHMSGEEFLARWRTGEFGDPENPYRPELMHVVMFLPFAE